MNHPLVVARVRAIAKTLAARESHEQRVLALFQQTLQREPHDNELAESLKFIHEFETEKVAIPVTAKDWRYGFGMFDHASQRVRGFTALPHFTGKAWQGGDQWPDAKLGWVQLTADGGHPGNNRNHAAIRRWIAPRAMTVAIRSKLIHQAEPGDGIRAFIVSSETGLLNSAQIHQKTVELNITKIEVAAGASIDFVVDIGNVLNNDQYLWESTLSELHVVDRQSVWNSKADFPRGNEQQLNAWEQLAQVLLCSNEFMFVD